MSSLVLIKYVLVLNLEIKFIVQPKKLMCLFY